MHCKCCANDIRCGRELGPANMKAPLHAWDSFLFMLHAHLVRVGQQGVVAQVTYMS